jgi:Kef-type K+ transport system membrane component KefB
MTSLTVLSFPIVNPTWIFFVVLMIILLAPLVFERFHIPQIVGMILAGVLVGPYALNILTRDSSFELFGQVGLYYIMFLAGLSMDVSALKYNRLQLVSFGLASYAIPFVLGGLATHFLLGFSAAASVLIACILSSHTLVAFSIVSRYGLTRYRGVTLSVVATMISLILSLLSLAVLAGSFRGESGPLLWGSMLLKAAAFAAFLFLVYPRLIRYFFRRFSDDVLQYIFVLALVFFSAAVSEMLGLEGVLGAFLSGLILNRYIPETVPLMRHIDFVGNALFIPYFLIGVGMLINLPELFSDVDNLLVILAIVFIAILTKWLACLVTDKAFHLGRDMRQMMTGLTTGHAAGALAMVMVGRQLYVAPGEPLANDVVLNAMVMLILLSCIFSAFVTTSASKRIARSGVSDEEKQGEEDKILVALSNPKNTANLVNIALMMRPHRSTAPLVGVKLIVDAKDNERELDAARQLVKNAAQISASAGVSMKKVVRSGVNIVTAMKFTMKDFEASEIIIGAHGGDGRTTSSFSGAVTDLLERISRQIIIVKCRRSVSTIRQIHVVVPQKAELEVGFHRWLMHVSRLARQKDCQIVYYCPDDAWDGIETFCHKHYSMIRMAHVTFDAFSRFPDLTDRVHPDHLLVLVSAREGSFSWQPCFQKIPEMLDNYFTECSVMLIFPDQYGIESRKTSFTTGFPHASLA